MLTNCCVAASEKPAESSLHILASKFIAFMESQPDGLADIPAICAALDVQKRRIYDVTNVLEGIGLLQKYGKNGYKWRCVLRFTESVICLHCGRIP